MLKGKFRYQSHFHTNIAIGRNYYAMFFGEIIRLIQTVQTFQIRLCSLGINKNTITGCRKCNPIIGDLMQKLFMQKFFNRTFFTQAIQNSSIFSYLIE